MMSSPGRTLASMKRTKRRKRRTTIEPGPVIVATVSLALALFLWLLGAALLKGSSTSSEALLTLGEKGHGKLLANFPDSIVDLFPSRLKNTEFVESLTSCLPSKDESRCQTRVDPTDPVQHVVIASTPGVLGIVFEEFVADLLELRVPQGEELDFTLTASPHVGPGHTVYTKVVRAAVVPPLLEAIDLALLATTTTETTSEGEDAYPMDRITWEDIVGIVRILARWHCRLSVVAQDTALLTIELDKMLPAPNEVEDALADFLDISKDGKDVDVNEMAAEVLVRMDECTAFAMALENKSPNKRLSLENAAAQALLEELKSPTCQSTIKLEEAVFPIKSQVIEIVAHLLDVAEESSKAICKRHPGAILCETLQDDIEEA